MDTKGGSVVIKRLAVGAVVPAIVAGIVIIIALVGPSRVLGPISLSCYSYAYGCGTPTVTSIYPTAGPTTGGTTVTIYTAP